MAYIFCLYQKNTANLFPVWHTEFLEDTVLFIYSVKQSNGFVFVYILGAT